MKYIALISKKEIKELIIKESAKQINHALKARDEEILRLRSRILELEKSKEIRSKPIKMRRNVR